MLMLVGKPRRMRLLAARAIAVGAAFIPSLSACGAGEIQPGAGDKKPGPAENQPAIAAAPPGKLVDVDGRKIHIIDEGEGSPVVVLLAGMGDFSVDWARVQPDARRLTRTISYDRAGEAWSEAAPDKSPTGLEAEAADLHRALEAAKALPPYVLVGHSWGGAVARVFAAAHPDDVAGLVLVDSTHEDTLLWINGKVMRPRLISPEEWSAIWKVPPDAKPMPMRPKPPDRVNPPYDKLPSEAQKQRLWAMGAQMFRPVDFRKELEALHRARGDGEFPLGDRPLIVLTRSLPATDEEKGWTVEQQEKDHQRLMADLLRLSRNSRQVVVENSGHHIALDQPQAVLDALKEVHRAVRDKSKLEPVKP